MSDSEQITVYQLKIFILGISPMIWRRIKVRSNSTIAEYEQVAKNQGYKCPICAEYLLNGEDIETHHIVPVAKGGRNDDENLTYTQRVTSRYIIPS